MYVAAQPELRPPGLLPGCGIDNAVWLTGGWFAPNIIPLAGMCICRGAAFLPLLINRGRAIGLGEPFNVGCFRGWHSLFPVSLRPPYGTCLRGLPGGELSSSPSLRCTPDQYPRPFGFLRSGILHYLRGLLGFCGADRLRAAGLRESHEADRRGSADRDGPAPGRSVPDLSSLPPVQAGAATRCQGYATHLAPGWGRLRGPNQERGEWRSPGTESRLQLELAVKKRDLEHSGLVQAHHDQHYPADLPHETRVTRQHVAYQPHGSPEAHEDNGESQNEGNRMDEGTGPACIGERDLS